ncbi:MAG: YkgJ family cysteine cluster protein [Planctomycetaceae bacterium]
MMGICEGCHSGCCRAFAVPLTGADIIRLESRTEMTFWDFGCRWVDHDHRIAQQQAPHFYFPDEPATPFVICLKHEASSLHPGVTRCGFLKEFPADADRPLGSAHCGVYDHRPQTCRTFPAQLNETSELAVLYDIPNSARDGGHPQYSLCPRPWSKGDIDPIQHVQDLIVSQFEMKFFRKLAEAWNRNPQEWMVFPEFIRDVYARRVLDRQTSTLKLPDSLVEADTASLHNKAA